MDQRRLLLVTSLILCLDNNNNYCKYERGFLQIQKLLSEK